MVTEKAMSRGSVVLSPGKSDEMTGDASSIQMSCRAIRCANEECNRLSLFVGARPGYRDVSAYRLTGPELFEGRIYPSGAGKPFPVGVPVPMLADYQEAWAILNLSPKSAATLARRCLQAMIRDFCNIRERTLYHEIEKLEERLAADDLPKGVEPETIAAMKVLKDKGNIGAHMTEVDGRIVDVEPGEAAQLLGLIEMLFSDWYVARHKRQQSLAKIEAMAKPTDTLP